MMEEHLTLSDYDRSLIENLATGIEGLTAEIRRMNGNAEKAEPDVLLTCSEAATLCDVTRQTISRWIREKRIRKVRRGGRSGILKSELVKCKSELLYEGLT